MAHHKIHLPITVMVQDNDIENQLMGCKTQGQDCGAWAAGVTELTLFSYDNTGEVQYNHTTIVSAIGCTACQFGRNVHPFEHEEIGSSANSSNWSLGIYDYLVDAVEDATLAVAPAARHAVTEIAQQAIARKDSKR